MNGLSGKPLVIENGRIIGPDRVYEGDVIVREGRIASIAESGTGRFEAPEAQVLDAAGMFVMPGIIETHSDAIEREVQPRPGSIFPLEMAMYELEKKMTAVGITTLYHSICSSDGTPVRNDEMVARIVEFVASKRGEPAMIRHRIHMRYEITNVPGLDMVKGMLDREQIDLLSLMDHTPGQGQYSNREVYQNYLMGSENMTREEADRTIDQLSGLKDQVDWSRIAEVVRYAQSKGVVTASHDDDTLDKVNWMHELGVAISEFPVNLEAAQAAASKRMHVSVGAPNVVRGASHNHNMRAIDAIKSGAADILCSDYHPSSLLPALFHIVASGIELSKAVRMVTYHPAEALGIEAHFGSVEVGKVADLVVLELHDEYPIVRSTLVGGTVVYAANFFEEEKGA
ncbi:alpha-D-ribose 1-methylphosphonate 5-triphosphate diphosphatase [Cohnella abietis]|uniref:Alpha-D-ribose 1-methylphosphonate 5-triphosphate diphosphatase n=1 Tax=Cohnella abietis TaxID=2507935 RepID=A0A3T1DCQ2_9BACL|nr:alpha-D-ribose 1-methylphosphonate 5-triphosphate diphosphatase [Cohnella abietis]BBI35926.1 alpha-D-ribose 1-methylphosphonate 5-triphosphate diphosphatase [Cohnella abietis]